MNKICQDVFNNICDYLSIDDIGKLKQTNKLIRNYVINFEDIYLTYQLKTNYMNISMIEKKRNFYSYIKYIFCNFYINKSLFKNDILDNMILDIYNTRSYLNILNTIIINCFINIVYFPYNITIESGFNFLQHFNKPSNFYKFKDIILNYYTYILDCIHNDRIIRNKFKIIYDISPHIINIYSLKKIFSYRMLDLSKTDILFCCNLEHCIVDNINSICDTKYAYYNDDLISHNYIEIKKFLYNRCIEYYNILIYRENFLLNEKIFIKNPITNRRMRVNGKRWMHLILTLKKKNKSLYNDIIMDVLNQQDILRNKIFGKFNI
jgi:hypothetical protein